MDNAIQHYAQTEFLVKNLHEGRIPHWWPEVGAGSPVVAEGQAAHYHPVRLLLGLVLSAPAVFMGEVGIYLALAGLGTFFYLRQIHLNRIAALAGAISFMFGSQCVVYVRSMVLLRAGCLLPWLLLLAERLIQRGRYIELAWVALAVALQFLSGNPTFAIVALLGIPAYLICRVMLGRERGWKRAAAAVVGWGAAAAVGIAMAAIQVIPTFMHLPFSVRESGFSAEYLAHSLVARMPEMLQFVFPFTRHLGDVTSTGAFNPASVAGFYCGGLMAVALAYAVLAVRRKAAAGALAAGAILATILALGGYAYLSKLPIFGSMRFPVRYLFWATLCVSCLSAVGLHLAMAWSRLRRASWSRYVPVLLYGAGAAVLGAAFFVKHATRRHELLLSLIPAAVGLILVALLVRGSRHSKAIALAGALILTGDLLIFREYWGYAQRANTSEALGKSGAVAWLSQDREAFRTLTLRIDPDRLDQAPLQETFQTGGGIGSTAANWDLSTLNFSFSLGLKDYNTLLAAVTDQLEKRPERAQDTVNLLGFLRTKYALGPKTKPLEGWEKVWEGRESAIWKNPEFRNADVVVGRVTAEPAGELKTVPLATPVAYREAAVVKTTELPKLDPALVVKQVRRIPVDDPDRMEFQVSTTGVGLLVIPSNYYPGWEARVNGKPAQIYKTNWVGMGVVVGPGESNVSLRFETPGWRLGLWVSVASVAFWAAALLWLRKTKREDHEIWI
jgi:hypothetical protein